MQIDWSGYSIKMDKLHKELDHALNLEETQKALELIEQMQAELAGLKAFLQQ